MTACEGSSIGHACGARNRGPAPLYVSGGRRGRSFESGSAVHRCGCAAFAPIPPRLVGPPPGGGLRGGGGRARPPASARLARRAGPALASCPDSGGIVPPGGAKNPLFYRVFCIIPGRIMIHLLVQFRRSREGR